GCINDGMGFDLGLLPVIAPGAQALDTCANTTNGASSAGGVSLDGSRVLSNQLLTCAVEAGTYNTNPCQSTETWPNPAVPGQGAGQDKGDLYMITSAAGLPCPVTSLTRPYEYDSEYGRILGPNTGVANPVGGSPSSTNNHLIDQYEASPVSFTA